MTRYRRGADQHRMLFLAELAGAAILGAGVYIAVVLVLSLGVP